MKTRIWLGLVSVGLLLTGCGGTGSSGGSASLRAFNAAMGVTAATITVGASIVMEGGSYGGSTNYTNVNTGNAVQVMVTDQNNTTLVQTGETISGNIPYTAYLVGTDSAASLLLLAEDHSTPPSGQLRMNFVNLSPTIPSVDVYATDPSVTDLTTVSASGIAYQSSSPITVNSGNFIIRFTANGSKTVIASYSAGSLGASTLARYLLLDQGTGSGQQITSLFD
jgi:hypothetical protein